MRKDELIAALEELRTSLTKLSKSVNAFTSENIYKPEIRQMAGQVSATWFDSIKQVLPSFGVNRGIIESYDSYFESLLQASIKPATKTSTYVKTLSAILEGFSGSILIPVHKSAGAIADVSHLENILESIANEDERRYLEQAVGCARHGYRGASVVLAWCAAMDRVQKKVEHIGFAKFNETSEAMSRNPLPRYKKLRRKHTASNLDELRYDVPEAALLMIIEGLGLIDGAQRERLDDCYTKRCSAAHPGNAVITEDNLRSVFSDLKEIVFDNPRFAL